MKPVIEDLLMVKASAMAAAGLIAPGMTAATVQFGDVGYVVGVKVRRFPKCGGWWALFICPRCGSGAQRLRLLDDQPACGKCVRATGMRYRTDMVSHASKRTALTAPKRIARLNGGGPLRVHARPGRGLEGRASIEFALRRSLIVERKAKIAQFEKDLGKS